MLIGCNTILIFNKHKLESIEDETIRNAKMVISSGVNDLKKKYGTQMMSFPEIKYIIVYCIVFKNELATLSGAEYIRLITWLIKESVIYSWYWLAF